ncbi:MAG TPA: peptidoglycan-binding protein [Mycobacteriales bacterium]|nr:peptidoglycan-binding protein [Mycobacteriales bacterium]
MIRTLRGTAVAVLALLVSTATVGSASADGTDFTMSPLSGPVGTTVTVDAAGTTTFSANAGSDPTTSPPAAPTVSFDGVPSTSVTMVSPTELTAVVPSGATTGPVTVAVGTTTYTGPSFTVEVLAVPRQPAWTATASQPTVTYGRGVTVKGLLADSQGAVSGAPAQLQAQQPGNSGWVQVPGTATKATNAAGVASWRLFPQHNEHLRIASSATSGDFAAVSAPIAVQVAPKLTLHQLGVASTGVTSHLTGTVRPAGAGTVELQQRRGGIWRGVSRASARTGRFSFALDPTTPGVERFRVTEPATALHAAAASQTVRVDVTRGDLRYGSTGPEVRALQRRLRQLHYDVGPPSSTYGWDMVHAVTAFEKVQGITRDGVAGPQTWRRLGNPKVPHLRHPYPDAPVAVEVNLATQILMIAKHGVIWRILDTSTAGGYTYTDSAGLQATAVTPTGHFTIKYKIDHLVTDKLGTLWRPSYFDYSGDAIHGEGDSNSGADVPPYAASHGCVRITDLAVDRYYNLLAIGTPVWIYH